MKHHMSKHAGGGTVGCYFGPNIRKSLNHPAIIDWALVEYMKYTTMVQKDMDLEKPFQKELGLSILKRAKDEFDKIKYLNMFQKRYRIISWIYELHIRN